MRKAYRITGSSFYTPENLPEGFTVKERLVGEVMTAKELAFHEVKDGSLVVYQQGVAGSNVKITLNDVYRLMVFCNKIVNDHYRPDMYRQPGCPGTPHRGHTRDYETCPQATP